MSSQKLSKKEKRLKRKLEKEAKNREKKVRQADGFNIRSKFVRVGVVPDMSKPITTYEDRNNYKAVYFQWCCSRCDNTGLWSWGESREWSDSEYDNNIRSHLDKLLNNSWGEVEAHTYNGRFGYRKSSNKYQPLDSLCEEAQDRWQSNEILCQFEELFRFRVGSTSRIWGVRHQHHFFMVWYERHHKICPVNSKK